MLFLISKKTHGHGQPCGDCWGEGHTMGLNGKNTIKIKCKKISLCVNIVFGKQLRFGYCTHLKKSRVSSLHSKIYDCIIPLHGLTVKNTKLLEAKRAERDVS